MRFCSGYSDNEQNWPGGRRRKCGEESVPLYAAGAGTITPTQRVTLDASSSPYPITFDGGGTTQLLIVNSGSLSLDGLTLAHGSGTNGGALWNNGGSVTVTTSTFSGNTAPAGQGGALAMASGTLTLSGTIVANSPSGGNCVNGGTITDQGYNLTDGNGVPLQPATTTASSLISSLDGQLGANAVSVLATYANGCFVLDVPGYTSDQHLSPSQGIFLLSSKAGSWMPPGSAYASGQPVSLQPGWTLAASPYPYGGVNGDGINGEIGASGTAPCGLQEIVTYSGGSYHENTPGGGPAGAAFNVPVTAGMWIECTSASTWTHS